MSPSNRSIRKLAVLPFKSLAGTDEKAFYAEASSELISVKLGSIDDLGLTEYTSMRLFKDSEKPIPEIARDLNRDALLTGSVIYWGIERSPDRVKELTAAVNEALRLGPDLAETHFASGVVSLYNRQFAAAEQSFELALDIDPNMCVAYVNLGNIDGILGRNALSVQNAKKAADLDPLNSKFIQALGWAYFRSKDYDNALKIGQRAIEIDSESFIGYHVSAFALTAMGRDEEAETNFRLAYQKSGQAPFYMARLGYGLGVLGKKEEANELLERLEDAAENDPWSVTAFQIGFIHLGLGNDEQALELFDKSLQEREANLIFLGSNSYFDGNREPLRENLQYKPLLRKIGLPE